MASEAQKKANQKYKSNIKRFTVDFTPSEADLFLYLSNKPNKQRYIKDLIASDKLQREKTCIQ